MDNIHNYYLYFINFCQDVFTLISVYFFVDLMKILFKNGCSWTWLFPKKIKINEFVVTAWYFILFHQKFEIWISFIKLIFHCAKNVQIQRFIWCLLSRIKTKHRDLLCESIYSVLTQENTNQICIWTFLMQCLRLKFASHYDNLVKFL